MFEYISPPPPPQLFLHEVPDILFHLEKLKLRACLAQLQLKEFLKLELRVHFEICANHCF